MKKGHHLTWQFDPETAVYRAADAFALYVISKNQRGRFRVGFFPAPGPEALWVDDLASLDDAKASARDCAAHVHAERRKMDHGK